MAAKLNLIMRGGNTFTRTFNFKDSAGAGVDVTGDRLVLTISGGTVSPMVKDTAAPGSGFSFVSGQASRVKMFLTADETDTLAGRKVTYEVERFYNDGADDRQDTVFEGTISTKRGVNGNV